MNNEYRWIATSNNGNSSTSATTSIENAIAAARDHCVEKENGLKQSSLPTQTRKRFGHLNAPAKKVNGLTA